MSIDSAVDSNFRNSIIAHIVEHDSFSFTAFLMSFFLSLRNLLPPFYFVLAFDTAPSRWKVHDLLMASSRLLLSFTVTMYLDGCIQLSWATRFTWIVWIWLSGRWQLHFARYVVYICLLGVLLYISRVVRFHCSENQVGIWRLFLVELHVWRKRCSTPFSTRMYYILVKDLSRQFNLNGEELGEEIISISTKLDKNRKNIDSAILDIVETVRDGFFMLCHFQPMSFKLFF